MMFADCAVLVVEEGTQVLLEDELDRWIGVLERNRVENNGIGKGSKAWGSDSKWS